MIELNVKEYCHSCPEFAAVINGPNVLYGNDAFQVCKTEIVCEHRKLCEHIEEYLETKRFRKLNGPFDF